MSKKGKKGKLKDDFWLDSEDDRLRRRFRESGPKFSLEEEAPAKPKIQIPKEVTVTVPRIQIPKTVTIKVPRVDSKKIKKLPSRAVPIITKYKWWVVAGCAAVVILIGGLIFSAKPSSKDDKKKTAGSSSAKLKADFTPVVSLSKKSKSDSDQGLKYNPERKTISLQDDYFGKRITISQQKLTKEIANDPSTLVKAANTIAQAFSLSLIERQAVPTATHGQLYYYNIPKSTEQRAVMKYDDVLIFFRTDKQLDKEDWADYANSLTRDN